LFPLITRTTGDFDPWVFFQFSIGINFISPAILALPRHVHLYEVSEARVSDDATV
jgi:hypothetical protein